MTGKQLPKLLKQYDISQQEPRCRSHRLGLCISRTATLSGTEDTETFTVDRLQQRMEKASAFG